MSCTLQIWNIFFAMFLNEKLWDKESPTIIYGHNVESDPLWMDQYVILFVLWKKKTFWIELYGYVIYFSPRS